MRARTHRPALVIAAASLAAIAASAQTPPAQKPAGTAAPLPVDGYEIVATYPHDTTSFTQGLELHGSRLLESQGQYGQSALRLVDLATGSVVKRVPLDDEYFAEGVTVLRGIVYLVTWKENKGFFYAGDDLRQLGTFTYAGIAWGLANDGKSLILSDGSDVLRFLDPNTFAVTKKLAVRAQGRAVYMLNELERVRGEIWANIWYSDRIARIDPTTGAVLGWIDLAGLHPQSERKNSECVLNGIAWDAARDRIFVTGKHWPKLFEIRVKKKS